MTSFKRRLYDRAHRKGFYGNRKNRDGNLVLHYGKTTTLAQFHPRDELAADMAEDAFDRLNRRLTEG